MVPPEPSWEAFVASRCPIRELAAGDRPGDWVASANDWEEHSPDVAAGLLDRAVGSPDEREGAVTAPLPDAAPARVEPGGGHVEQQRFKVQFTASEEYVRLVEEAKALLSHAVPSVTLEELQLRATRARDGACEEEKHVGIKKQSHQASQIARTPLLAQAGIFELSLFRLDMSAEEFCCAIRARVRDVQLRQVPVPNAGHDGVGRRAVTVRLPAVMTQSEVTAMLGHFEGTPTLMASLLFGATRRCLKSRRSSTNTECRTGRPARRRNPSNNDGWGWVMPLRTLAQRSRIKVVEARECATKPVG